jgi:hypothetical protein
MQMAPAIRRVALTLHVVCSVGWIGAAAAYLALAVAAGTSQEVLTVRAAWIVMQLTGWYVLVPLGCLAFLTGLLMSLGTPWGLLRHYWVLIALLLTTLTLAVLLLHMPTVTRAADLARSAGDAAAVTLGGDVVHPALGLVALVVALNIHKPRGLTRFGQRRQPDARARLPRQQQGLRQVDQSSAIED